MENIIPQILIPLLVGVVSGVLSIYLYNIFGKS